MSSPIALSTQELPFLLCGFDSSILMFISFSILSFIVSDSNPLALSVLTIIRPDDLIGDTRAIIALLRDVLSSRSINIAVTYEENISLATTTFCLALLITSMPKCVPGC